MIALDNSADIFGGNENDRAQVRQFIGLMRGMAIDAIAAVIIATHPSLTGITSGSGLSGNTAWHNSVRARAYMKSAKTEDGTEPDKALRLVEFMKSNYGPVADAITVRWKVPESKSGSLEKLASEAKADHAFLRLLERFDGERRTVGERPGHSYAPAVFSEEPEAKASGLNKKALADAMRRLFASKKIHIEQYGRPSRPRFKARAWSRARAVREAAMRRRTSPRTSGVHRTCIDVHRACPSPPLYPPVRDTHARGLYGPCACHTKFAQAERGAAKRNGMRIEEQTISGFLWPVLGHPKKDCTCTSVKT